ncbi:MAG: DUF3343 domain-containing protein [Clostridiaceae bacterium]|nr:DUF3343 domain-containing protein [Clostridiaceae bacterium]
MIAIFSSLTTVNRIKRYFQSHGEVVTILQTPKELSKGGCTYSIRLQERQLRLLRQAAEELGVKIKGIYRETQQGGKRVYEREGVL